jgi:hypothetical protein
MTGQASADRIPARELFSAVADQLTRAQHCMRVTPQSEREQLLSLSALARRLDLPYPRAIELHERGVIVADYITANAILFRTSRLTELRAAIRKGS